jgi:hypothetical protein
MEYLKGIWSEDLAELTWKIIDAPAISQTTTDIPRWRVDEELNLIIIYRITTERFGSHSRKSSLDERLKVEEQVFEAVAEYLDVDPWDLVPDYFAR